VTVGEGALPDLIQHHGAKDPRPAACRREGRAGS
jgi:hypothetical protein